MMPTFRWPRALVALAAASLASWAWPETTVTLLHINDQHARLDSSRVGGVELGGFARLATLVRQHKASDPNPVFLNGGDVFMGTLFFTVYEGMADLAALNYMGTGAMAVGNHEFDKGPTPLANFARLASFPLLAANLDVSGDPDLQGLVKPWAPVRAGSETLAVVGAIVPELFSISSPGDTVRMRDLVSSVQAAVDEAIAAGHHKVVLLSHIGFRQDLELGAQLRGVDVIVGGHSHTLLGDLGIEGVRRGVDDYPVVIQGADGKRTLVVQAWEWGRVLGRLKVTFSDQGDIVRWEGGPIPVVNTIPEDLVMASMLEAFRRPVAEMANQPVGNTERGILRGDTRGGESAMGNLIADAMLAATSERGAVVALMNAGGIRADLEPGEITFGEALTVQPFANTLVLLDVTGAELRAALEHGAGRGGMLHVSRGFRYVMDPSRPDGQRVIEVSLNGVAIDPARVYRIVTNSFVAGGGDAHVILRDATGFRYDSGIMDVEALIQYMKANTPTDPVLEGRISRR